MLMNPGSPYEGFAAATGGTPGGGAPGGPTTAPPLGTDPERIFLAQRAARRQAMGWEGKGNMDAALDRFHSRQPTAGQMPGQEMARPPQAQAMTRPGGADMGQMGDRIQGAMHNLYANRMGPGAQPQGRPPQGRYLRANSRAG